MALLLRVWAPKARIDALTRPKQHVMISKVSTVVIEKIAFNAYKTARMMPMILAALMFEAQQQGILENLKKKRKLDYLLVTT